VYIFSSSSCGIEMGLVVSRHFHILQPVLNLVKEYLKVCVNEVIQLPYPEL
jgi:hypothetical protein